MLNIALLRQRLERNNRNNDSGYGIHDNAFCWRLT